MLTRVSSATIIISALLLSPAALAKTKDNSSSEPVTIPERVTCEGVFGKDVTLDLLIEHFGKDNVVARTEIGSVEGDPLYGTEVFGKDPNKILRYHWFDEKELRYVSFIELPPTLATPEGLYVGQSIAEVEELNGERFGLSGFWWDYGGYPFLHEGGKLWKENAPCTPMIRFSPTVEDISDEAASIAGDTTVYSDDPLLTTYDVRVYEAGIGYEFPEGYDGFDEGDPVE